MQYFSEELNSKISYAFGDELGWLRSFGETLRPYPIKTVLMIGCGPAIHALAVYEGLQTKQLNFYIIDIKYDGTAEKHLQQIGYGNCVHYLLGRSQDIIVDIPKIDFLIVDGDHTFLGVKGDIEAWWDKVVIGGYVFFHDVIDVANDSTNGVAQAIQEALTTGPMKDHAELIASPGISEVYRKK